MRKSSTNGVASCALRIAVTTVLLLSGCSKYHKLDSRQFHVQLDGERMVSMSNNGSGSPTKSVRFTLTSMRLNGHAIKLTSGQISVNEDKKTECPTADFGSLCVRINGEGGIDVWAQKDREKNLIDYLDNLDAREKRIIEASGLKIRLTMVTLGGYFPYQGGRGLPQGMTGAQAVLTVMMAAPTESEALALENLQPELKGGFETINKAVFTKANSKTGECLMAFLVPKGETRFLLSLSGSKEIDLTPMIEVLPEMDRLR